MYISYINIYLLLIINNKLKVMGVPGLFANLKKKYQNIIKRKIINTDKLDISTLDHNNDINTLKPYLLFFDFNCLMHPICHLLWKEYSSKNIDNYENFEQKIMVKSLEYLEKVVEYADPSICAIFIDGVCPMSKMAQQRQRRFASIIDKEIMNDIRKKNKINEENYYDTNSITPGTLFMDKFNKFIHNYIASKKDSKIKYIYSSYLEVGEGEHKIINYIKNNETELIDKEIMIYGLDADLIILSLTLTDRFKIKLLREEDQVSFDEFKMMIFDVNKCAESIIIELSNDLSESETLDRSIYLEKYNYIHDFIFITILLGNDFIPANPTLNMRFHNKHIKSINGYDLLIDTYKIIMNENKTEYIVNWTNNRLTINWTIFKELINKLATYEQEYFESARIRYNPSKGEKNIAESEIEIREHLAFTHPDPLKMYYRQANYNSVRKLRYIHHYFGKKVCNCTDETGKTYGSQLYNSKIIDMNDKFYFSKQFSINQSEYDNVIQKYLNTISYIMYYYYQGCPNNMYFHKNISGILLSDLFEYLNKSDNILLDKTIDMFYNNKVYTKITPLEQLLIVLPPKSYNLLPLNIQKMMLSQDSKNILLNEFIINYLPDTKSIKRDYLNKSKLYQSNLIFKMPKHIDIIALISDIQITSIEALRSLII